MLEGKRVNEMKSWYKKFIGTIEPDSRGFNIHEVLEMKNIIEFIIKKLPIHTCTNSYYQEALQCKMNGNNSFIMGSNLSS